MCLSFLLSDGCIKSSCINSHELRFERRDLGTQPAFAVPAQHIRCHAYLLQFGGDTVRCNAHFRTTLLLASVTSRTQPRAAPRGPLPSSSAAPLSFAHCSYFAAGCCARARLPRSDRRAVAACQVRLLLLISAPQSGYSHLRTLLWS